MEQKALYFGKMILSKTLFIKVKSKLILIKQMLKNGIIQ